MRYRSTLTLILALAGLLLACGDPLYAQRSGWQAPLEISPLRADDGTVVDPDARRYGSAWFPDLAAAPDGSLRVVWYSGIALPDEGQGNSLDLLMYRELRGGRWSAVSEAVAVATGGYTVRNNIVAGRDGRLHALFRKETRVVYANAPLEQSGVATKWSTPITLSGFGSAYYTAFATDSKGYLHAFWSEAVEPDATASATACMNCSDLFYRRSEDGGKTWSPSINLSTSVDGENRPQVKIDRYDHIHVVWDEGIDWYAGAGLANAGVYRRSDDGGKTWGVPTFFRLPDRAVAILRRQQAQGSGGRPTPTPVGAITPPVAALDAVQQTSLGIDGAGNPLVVYRGATLNQIYAQYSPDGGTNWMPAIEIPGLLARISDLDIYSMATDGSGIIHLMIVAYRTGEHASDPTTPPGLYHLSWTGAGWQAPEPVMRGELYPEYPKIAVINGNELHAVWFTRSREDLFNSERAHYKIWHSQKLIGALMTPPAPTFTPLPTAIAPTTEPSPTPAPSPTALDAALRNLPPNQSQPAWERFGVTAIGFSLLPVVLLIATIIIVQLIRRWTQR